MKALKVVFSFLAVMQMIGRISMENECFVAQAWAHLCMEIEVTEAPCRAAGCCKMSSRLGTVALFLSVLLFGKLPIFQ